VVVKLQTVRPEFEVKVKTTKRNPITKVKHGFRYFCFFMFICYQLWWIKTYIFRI